MLRDRLLARLADFSGPPDYVALAADVLGIRGAPPALARRLVEQALVIEDRRDAWRAAGERIVAAAPVSPGVYILRDEADRALYVGKAINLRRRLAAHFTVRRWRALPASMARAASAEWQVVGSELEALLREAALIAELQPVANVQIGPPDPETRSVPTALRRDVIVVVPSIDPDSAELVSARADGGSAIQRTRRDGADLAVHAPRLRRFFGPRRAAAETSLPAEVPALAPIVFSWLAGRGAAATRVDPHDTADARALRHRLAALLRDERLFLERLDQR